jgi:SAM-dependent methyltransferase
MPFSMEDIRSYFCCPDDGATMAACAGGLRCEQCERLFPLLSANILELLPSRPISFPEGADLALYRQGYLREFFRPLEIREGARAWGAPEANPRKWLRTRERQASEVFHFLRDESNEEALIFCDLSAGAGHFTFKAARKYRLVFHCELSIDSLAYASAKAVANHLENIVFVHADYFQPPFRNSIHHLVCLDTLIRGPWHEKRLLQTLPNILARDGSAVVDFHNWWHNPLRRLGLLPDNFVGNKSYSRKELAGLLLSSGIGRFETRPFLQEVDSRGACGKILARFIPATRLMVRLAGASNSALQAPDVRLQEGKA